VRRFLIAVAALALSLPAHAVTIGGIYEIDPSLAITTLSNKSGSIATHGHNYSTFTALGNNWGGSGRRTTLNDSKASGAPNASLMGTFANPLTNIPGYDFYLFESGDASTAPNWSQAELVAVSLTGAAGTWIDMAIVGFLLGTDVGDARGTNYGVYVLAFDLSALGVADGVTVSSLYFANSGTRASNNNPDIVYAAGVAVTPLPGALPLFGGGLSLMSFFGWWKRKKAIAAA